MAVAVVPREDNAFANDNPPPARNAILARYCQLREISKRHHHGILKLISGNAVLQQAHRLGLAQGRTLILDDMEEMNYVFDLAIHTAPPGRSRAIDRYARSASLPPDSDEALMLEAMRAARTSPSCRYAGIRSHLYFDVAEANACSGRGRAPAHKRRPDSPLQAVRELRWETCAQF